MKRVLSRGFSMIEVLVASGLLAIVGMLLLTSLSSAIDAKEVVEETSDRYHLVRQAMSRMVDEISMAYVSAHRTAAELRVKSGLKGERDRMDFTAFGYVPRLEDSKHSDQRELSYFIGVDPRTQSDALVRREQPDPDDEIDEGGREQVLLPGCRDLTFEYWDPQTEDWKDEWDSEDSAYLDRLPSRVRITFTAQLEEGVDQEFTTQTQIFLTNKLLFHN